MRTFTLKGLFLTTVFMLLGCLSIHAADDLITEQVVVKLDEAGTLPDKISENDKYKITNLKIIGEINGTDLRLIRDMAGNDSEGNETNGKLAILDLLEAKIVKGGDYYYSHYNYPNGNEEIYTSGDVIGDFAFFECSNLSNITLPSSLISIGYGAFAGCYGLTSITLPSSLISIGYGAFTACYGLTSITLPSSLISIGDEAFAGCYGLTSITLPSNLMSIGDEAFRHCSSLTCITIPSSITSIGKDVFKDCSNLTSATISSGVTFISEGAFRDCSSLTNVAIPKSVTRIRDWAFMGCSSLTNITIPDNATIGNGVFANCSNLINITIPFKQPYYIAYGVFANCSSLTSISIPANFYSIYSTAFKNCISLTSIAIPSSIMEIQEYAFEGCCGLKTVYVNWEKPLEIDASVFKEVDTKTSILYVPKGTLDAYKSSVWGDIFENIVEYDATGINRITTSGDAKEISRYAVNGQRLDAPTKGLNIVKYSDGSVKKVIVQ